MEYVEQNCTIEHNGKTITSGGALVTDTRAIGYLRIEREFVGACGLVTDWHGNTIGNFHVTAKWATPRSHISSTMIQVSATIDGKHYTGRGAGNGMVCRLKRKAK